MSKKKKKEVIKKLSTEEKKFLEELKKAISESGLKKELLERIDSPLVWTAFLEELPSYLKSEPVTSSELEDFLNNVKDRFSHNKYVNKALKRLIFKLKNKGIDINLDLEDKQEEPIIHSLETKKLVYMAPSIGDVTKVVLFALQTPPRFECNVILFNEEFQVSEFFLLDNLSKKDINSIKQTIDNKFLISTKLVEISPPYLRALLEDVDKNKLYDFIEDESFSNFKNTLQKLKKIVPPLERHPIYDLAQEHEIPAQITSSELETLFSNGIVLYWSFIDKMDEIEELNRELEKKSPIFLSKFQLYDIERDLKNKYKEKIIEPEKLIKKFEDLGYYFYKTDKKELFEICLKMIACLKKKEKVYDLVCDYMIDEALDFVEMIHDMFEEELEKERKIILKKENLIITPDEIDDDDLTRLLT